METLYCCTVQSSGTYLFPVFITLCRNNETGVNSTVLKTEEILGMTVLAAASTVGSRVTYHLLLLGTHT